MRLLLLFLFSVCFLFSTNAQTIGYSSPLPQFCPIGSITLTATNVPAGTIQWQVSATLAGPYIAVGASIPTLVVNTPGFYTVSVNSSPVVFYDTVHVTQSIPPVTSFTFNNNNTCSLTPINFTSNTSSGLAPYTYVWDFGDGNTSTQANPTHSYTALGCTSSSFPVQLIVTDALGCRDTANGNITVLQKPDLRLTDADVFSPFSNCDNAPTQTNPNFTLTVSNSSPNAACISSYTLDWGDGSPIVNNPTFPLSHTYTQLGAFNLVFSGVGTNSCLGSQTYVVGNQQNPAGGLATFGATTGLCAPTTIPFIITNWQNNSPGTFYNLDFGDGVSVTLTHPLNAADTNQTIFHTYVTSSCPIGTYTATLRVINACDSTPYTAGNIQIRNGPRSDFDIAPSPGCIGTQACFQNNTVYGSTGANCSNATVFSWNFGDPSSGVNNTSNLVTPCHTYSAPGTYIVTLISTNPCGSDTFVRPICINAPPTPGFNLSTVEGCAPLAVAATNTTISPAANCPPLTYLWTVAYVGSNCGTGSNFQFANGTTATSENPQFIFNTSGTYNITQAVTNSCGTFTVTRSVIIKRPPVVGLSAIANSCGTATINPTAIVSACGSTTPTYAWSFPGGVPATSTNANPGSIFYALAGTYTVTLAVTNECGTTTQTRTFTIAPSPDLAIPGNSIWCTGDAIPAQIFTSAIATTISWTNSNTAIGIGASGTGNIPTFTATNATATAITGTITVTASLGSCTNVQSYTITVNPRPAQPLVNTPVNYCQNETAVPLQATALPGHSLLWYTTATGGTGSSTVPIPFTTIIGPTNYYVSQTNNVTGCESLRSVILVNVNPVPAIASISGTNPTACATATGSITLTGLLPSTSYTINYLRNGVPFVLILSSNAAGNIVIVNLIAATYSNFTVSRLGCTSNEVGPVTLVDPSAPNTPTLTSNGPICSGNTLTLNATSTTPGVTYSWTGPNGFTSNIANPTIVNATTASSGNYFVTATLASCVSQPGSLVVVVNQTPVIPTATNNGPLCAGDNLQLNASTTTAGAIDYVWTGPNGFTSILQNPTLAAVTLADAGLYTVTASLTSNGQTCTSASANTTVVVRPVPQLGSFIFTNPTSCGSNTGTITLNGLTPGASYTVQYLYNTLPVSIVLVADASGNILITGLAQGTYSNISVTLNGCTSNTIGPIVLTDPNPPATPVASSNAPICEGNTLNLSATSPVTGTIIFQWLGPNGFTSNLQNPSIPTVSALNAGKYYVSITVNSCTSLQDSVLVVVNPLPAKPTVVTPVTYCIGNVAMPLIATASAGNTLNWYTAATGGTAIAIAPTPSTSIAGTVFYYVSQTTAANCEGPRDTIMVVVNPDAVAQFSPTDTIGCPAFTITPTIINLQTYPTNNATYSWYADNILIGTGTLFPGYTITNANDSVTIKLVTSSLFGCKSDSSSRKFYTYKIANPSFTQNATTGCGPLSVTFNNTTPDINAFTYLWDFDNGQTSTLAQPGTIIFNSSASGNDTTYAVKLLVATPCDTVVFMRTVTVRSKPIVLFTPDRTNGCSPLRVTFSNNSLGNNDIYYWDLGDGTVFTRNVKDTFMHTYNSGIVDTFTVRLIAENSCGRDTIMYDIIIAPNNIRLSYTVSGTDLFGCAPHVVTFNNNSSGASNYLYDFGDGNIFASTSGVQAITHTYINSGTYTVSLQGINSCTDTIAYRTIVVYPKPVAAFSTADTVCIGQQVQFNNQTTGAGSYQWTFEPAATSVLLNPTYTFTTAGFRNVRLVAFNNNPSGDICTDTTFRTIVVRDTLSGNFTTSTTSAPCAPLTVTFTNNITPAISATWDFGDGTTAVGNVQTHTYNIAGTYLVNLIVRVAGGCVYTKTDTIRVFGPLGTLQYNGGFVCDTASVLFTAISNNSSSYLWNFGDGITLTTTTNTVYHSYNSPGLYLPSVTLQAGTCNILIQGLDTIKVDRIIPGFTETATQSCGSSVIQYRDTSNAFFGVASVSWNFGDNTTGTGSVVNHTYNTSATYNVTMTVTGISGCVKVVMLPVEVIVKSIPTASIIAPATACARQSVAFNSNVLAADPLSVLQWRVSNGATGSGSIFNYSFALPGTYTVQLIAGTAAGCFDTTQVSIIINPTPFVTASQDVSICLGNSVQLNANGAGSYQWDPPAGLSCTTCSNPVANPTNTTAYVVTGSNNFSCSSKDTVVVTVARPFNLSVSAADSICIGSSKQLVASGATAYLWSPAAGLNSTNISNPVATPTASTVYRVVGYDGFNCFTDTAFVIVGVGRIPTVQLPPDQVLSTGTQFPIASVVTNGPAVQYAWTPTMALSCDDCPLPIATVKKDIIYVLRITTAFGCTATDTINIKTFCESAQVFIPNAFTPDNDGLNDVLMVRGTGIVSVKHFRVFSRWGELVFERSNFPPNVISFGWNGKIKGLVGPPDVFVYTAEVICENGSTYTYKGNTSIIK